MDPILKIEVHNVRSKITDFGVDEIRKDILKYFTKKSNKSYWQQRRTPGWGGTTRFISEKKGIFPTGILPLVIDWCDKNSVQYELNDKRKELPPLGPPLSKNILNNVELRDYQLEAVASMLEKKRGLVKASTGSGKTVIASAFIMAVHRPTIYIVERINLAIQTKKRLIQYGFKKSQIGIVGGKFNEQNKLVTIATIQSAHKINNPERFEVLCVDESHHSKAKTYRNFLKSLTNAYYRVGLSGTVFGEDEVENMYRVSQFGPVIYEIGTAELIEEGVLSKPTIRMIEINEPYLFKRSSYIEEYKDGIVNNVLRNRIIAKFANGFKGKTLILFKIIEHGHILRDMIPKAIYMDGETDPITRQKIIEGFNRSNKAILLSSTIADEGIDFSSIDHLIIAGGERSIIKGIQRLGRGLRSDGSGEDRVNVIDFFDKQSKILQSHSRKRMKLYRSEGHEVKIFRLED